MIDERAVHVALAHLETGRPESALEELAPLLADHPDEPRLLLVAARASALAGDVAEAADLAARAVALAPGDVGALLLQAQIEVARGRSVPAARIAAAAVRLAPHDWRTHAQVVLIDLAVRAVYRTTVRAARAMLELAPDEVQAQVVAGRLAAARHRPRAARTHFTAALAMDPTNGEAQEGLAGLSARRLDLRPAADLARSRLAADPTDAVGTRVLDALTARLVLPALIGPPAAALLLWRYARPSEVTPSSTIAADQPVLLLAPLLLVVWLALQSVLLHRATGGRVWADVAAVPGFRLLRATLVAGGVLLAALPVLAVLPIAAARTALLAGVALWAAVLLVPLVVGGVLLRGRSGRRRTASVESWTGLRRLAPGVRPAQDRSTLLVVLALLAGPLSPALLLGAVGRIVPFDVAPLIATRPWAVGAVLPVLLAALCLVRAHRDSGGRVWEAVRRSDRFPAALVVAVAGAVSVAATIGALALPPRLAQLTVLLLLLGWMLGFWFGVLALLRRQRRARR